MKKIFAGILFAFGAGTAAASESAAEFTLRLLHFNDWHSRIEPVSVIEGECTSTRDAAGECYGGAARLAAAVAAARAQNGSLMLLNAGDNFIGSLYYTRYHGAVEAEFLNLMGVDAMAVGNHELSSGEQVFADFIDKVHFPVLSANLLPDEASPLAGRLKRSVVLERDGERIGIVGAVTTNSGIVTGPGTHIRLVDDLAAMAEAVAELEAQGIDKIIALTHVGYHRDVEGMARIPGVDVVVGGHSHSILANDRDEATGPYPTWVDNPRGYRVPVVQAGFHSLLLGDLTVHFDSDGVVTAADGAPILLEAKAPQDAAVLARIEELAGPIRQMKAEQIAEAMQPIDGRGENCRTRECSMGTLVTDAILERVQGQGIEIVIINGGSLRTSIDAGPVSRGDVLEALPFHNTVATMRLKGRHIVEALEYGVSGLETGRGRFPQVAGLKFRFDAKVPAREGRVSDVRVRDGEGNWVPIDPDALYGVATNDYLRRGGDGYAQFRDLAVDVYDFGPNLEEVVSDYLAEQGSYTPYLDGRITDASGTGR